MWTCGFSSFTAGNRRWTLPDKIVREAGARSWPVVLIICLCCVTNPVTTSLSLQDLELLSQELVRLSKENSLGGGAPGSGWDYQLNPSVPSLPFHYYCSPQMEGIGWAQTNTWSQLFSHLLRSWHYCLELLKCLLLWPTCRATTKCCTLSTCCFSIRRGYRTSWRPKGMEKVRLIFVAMNVLYLDCTALSPGYHLETHYNWLYMFASTGFLS